MCECGLVFPSLAAIDTCDESCHGLITTTCLELVVGALPCAALEALEHLLQHNTTQQHNTDQDMCPVPPANDDDRRWCCRDAPCSNRKRNVASPSKTARLSPTAPSLLPKPFPGTNKPVIMLVPQQETTIVVARP